VFGRAFDRLASGSLDITRDCPRKPDARQSSYTYDPAGEQLAWPSVVVDVGLAVGRLFAGEPSLSRRRTPSPLVSIDVDAMGHEPCSSVENHHGSDRGRRQLRCRAGIE
jgi:hypothetical protein